MFNPKKQESVDDRKIEDTDRVDLSKDDVVDESSSVGTSMASVGTSAISGGSNGNSDSGVRIGLTERLTDILVEDGDGDLLLQQSDREDRVIQWLQALDLQVIGACRADERLKPLLKLNVSTGAAEDRLLAHLSEHFEPSEVGMLARCLCMPLVSIRVGKINKQEALLCPTAIRGNLNLTLMPTSDLRMTFVGDDGCTERLATLCGDLQCSAVVVERIPTDKSERSFQIRIPNGEILYFWCSEKSKLLGIELLSKMKDLLKRKPSLTELTGISESRLDCFATHLRAYLVGSTVSNTRSSAVVSLTTCPDTTQHTSELRQAVQSLSLSSKPLRSRHYGSQTGKTNSLYQGSLSPRSSSFKEGLPRTLSSLRSIAREKLRRRGDNNLSDVGMVSMAPPTTMDPSRANPSQDKVAEASESAVFSTSTVLESLGKSAVPPFLSSASHVSSVGLSLLSPYYCWCPPVVSALQYTVAPLQRPISSTELPSLPPLSSLLPSSSPPSVLLPTPSLSLADVPSMEFPPFVPEPLVRLPLSLPSSKQIPTFTPLMCDPIVHIPVIDVCSSGQGYLVSAGAAISTTIPPLHPTLVNPLIPETESVVEKGARETLRLLLSSSSQINAGEKQGVLVTGSRGLYSGARDVEATIADSIAAMGLVTLSEGSGGNGVKRCTSQGSLVDLDKSVGPRGSCSEDDVPSFSNLSEERTD